MRREGRGKGGEEEGGEGKGERERGGEGGTGAAREDEEKGVKGSINKVCMYVRDGGGNEGER